jgi:hypothetical protein
MAGGGVGEGNSDGIATMSEGREKERDIIIHFHLNGDIIVDGANSDI